MQRDQRYDALQKALTETRLNSHLTQQEVALRLGKPQSFVSKYESGERRLDVIEFLEVCEALGVRPAAILRMLGCENAA
jgi:transcriptional regulator with XRE-family HTH domain